MLELIVLGEIPGTSIQITFKMVLGTATVLIGVLLLRIAEKRAVQAIARLDSSNNEPVLQ